MQESGQQWFMHVSGQKWFMHESGQQWFMHENGLQWQSWLLNEYNNGVLMKQSWGEHGMAECRLCRRSVSQGGKRNHGDDLDDDGNDGQVKAREEARREKSKKPEKGSKEQGVMTNPGYDDDELGEEVGTYGQRLRERQTKNRCSGISYESMDHFGPSWQG